jgi:hypothetical protein
MPLIVNYKNWKKLYEQVSADAPSAKKSTIGPTSIKAQSGDTPILVSIERVKGSDNKLYPGTLTINIGGKVFNASNVNGVYKLSDQPGYIEAIKNLRASEKSTNNILDILGDLISASSPELGREISLDEILSTTKVNANDSSYYSTSGAPTIPQFTIGKVIVTPTITLIKKAKGTVDKHQIVGKAISNIKINSDGKGYSFNVAGKISTKSNKDSSELLKIFKSLPEFAELVKGYGSEDSVAKSLLDPLGKKLGPILNIA